MRPVLSCAAAVVAAVALAGPAAADPPTRVTETIPVDDPVVAFECADGEPVLQTYTIYRTLTTFTDSSGAVLRTVRHARIPGTLYTADFSRQVPFELRIRREDDFANGTLTITGLRGVARLPGPDARSAGRIVFDLDTREQRALAGLDSYEAGVCAHLYG